MRDITGWVGGALGAAALLGAFYLGGRASAAAGSPSATPAAAAAAAAPAIDGVEFACAPGQRLVMRDATATTPRAAACVGEAMGTLAPAPTTTAPVYVPAAAQAVAPAVHRTVVTEPLEVYRPRSVPVSYQSGRDVRRPVRTKTKSAVIIGSSAAIGATIGGLTKGTKGAIIGGIVGGGAATVWDQVTRRQGEGR